MKILYHRAFPGGNDASPILPQSAANPPQTPPTIAKMAFLTLSSKTTPEVPITDPTLFIRALAFAADKHRAQRRLDAEANPYINHPIALTRVLSVEAGITDTEVLCAALLHDTIEDTDCTAEELNEEFGPNITAIVLEVTDDTSQPKPVRKQAQIDKAAGASPGAKLVKLADKICNLRDVLRSPPPGWTSQRRQDYFVWAGKVLVGLRGTHLRLEEIYAELVARRTELP